MTPRQQAIAAGELHYFTGKPCKRGHVAKRLVSTRYCVECASEQAKAYNAENREHRAAVQRAWRRANPEKNRASVRKCREANREKYLEAARQRYHADLEASRAKVRESTRKWRAANPEAARQHLRDHYWKNPEKARAARKAWVQANPEKARLSYTKIKAKRKGAEGSYTVEQIDELRKKQKCRCANCRRDMRKVGEHIDHVMPLARGGSNYISNIQLLCGDCNRSKSKRDPIEFAQTNGRLL